jgi:hypothetical protein
MLPLLCWLSAANNQKWSWLPDMRIRSWDANLCLQSCGVHNCAAMTLATCANTDAQRWLYDGVARLRPLNDATLCLQWTGSALILSDKCEAKPAFYWRVSGGLECVHSTSSACVQHVLPRTLHYRWYTINGTQRVSLVTPEYLQSSCIAPPTQRWHQDGHAG